MDRQRIDGFLIQAGYQDNGDPDFIPGTMESHTHVIVKAPDAREIALDALVKLWENSQEWWCPVGEYYGPESTDTYRKLNHDFNKLIKKLRRHNGS